MAALDAALPDHLETERQRKDGTLVDNVPSQRVIEANGGLFVEEFTRPASLGGGPEVRYRVNLS